MVVVSEELVAPGAKFDVLFFQASVVLGLLLESGGGLVVGVELGADIGLDLAVEVLLTLDGLVSDPEFEFLALLGGEGLRGRLERVRVDALGAGFVVVLDGLGDHLEVEVFLLEFLEEEDGGEVGAGFGVLVDLDTFFLLFLGESVESLNGLLEAL